MIFSIVGLVLSFVALSSGQARLYPGGLGGRNGPPLCPPRMVPMMNFNGVVPFAPCGRPEVDPRQANHCQNTYGPQYSCQFGATGPNVGVCCAAIGTTPNLPGCPAGYLAVPEARDASGGLNFMTRHTVNIKSCTPSANGNDCPFECVRTNPAVGRGFVCCMRQQ